MKSRFRLAASLFLATVMAFSVSFAMADVLTVDEPTVQVLMVEPNDVDAFAVVNSNDLAVSTELTSVISESRQSFSQVLSLATNINSKISFEVGWRN